QNLLPCVEAQVAGASPSPPAPIPPVLLGLPPHRRRFRILHLEPVRAAAGSIARAQPLRSPLAWLSSGPVGVCDTSTRRGSPRCNGGRGGGTCRRGLGARQPRGPSLRRGRLWRRLAQFAWPLADEARYPVRELTALGQEQPALLHFQVVLDCPYIYGGSC